MGAAAIPLAVVAVATLAAGTGYQISESEAAKKRAKAQQSKQDAEQQKLEGELQQRKSDEQLASANLAERSAARKRQRYATGGASARDTLLTGPLGLAEQAPTAQKSLLGL